MDMRTLKHLIHLVSVSNVGEVEIAEQDQKLRVVKAPATQTVSPDWPKPSGPAFTPAPAPSPSPVITAGAQATATAAKAPEQPAVRHVTEPDPTPRTVHRQVVTSPMVGRFYSGTGPAAKMGIKLGTQVRIGEPLCVIEALKIPTLIEAARSGKIAEIFCQNGEAVEYGQPLLIIE